MPQRELFMTHDLFELKDGGRAVYRHLEAMMRFCQEGIPSFKGPFIGKKAKKRPVGGGASSGPAAWATQAGSPTPAGCSSTTASRWTPTG